MRGRVRTAAQRAVSPIVNLALVEEFPIAELPVTTITRLHYTHITAADNALVSILEISNFDIDVYISLHSIWRKCQIDPFPC